MADPSTLSGVAHSIEAVLQKGAVILYDQYLNLKLPQHSNIDVNQTVTETIYPNFLQANSKRKFKIEKIPKNINQDKLGNFNIPLRHRSQLETTYQPKYLKRNPKNQKNIISIQQKLSIKPNNCFKNYCDLYDENTQKENQLRKEREQRGNMRKIIEQQLQRKKQKLMSHRKKIQQEFQQLAIKGISYTYDHNDGKIIQCNDTINPQNNIRGIKYQSLDHNDIVIMRQPKVKDIIGRKIGVYSHRIKRKDKFNNRQYNNNDNRQFSTIPFMNITEGVKVVEIGMNIVAMRRRSPQLTKDQFMKQNVKKRFKSFMPNHSTRISSPTERTATMFMTIDAQTPSRPGTTNITGKGTAATGSTARSILWRPHTTSASHRIRANKDLLEQMIK